MKNKYKILVVEAEESMKNRIAVNLENDGYQTVTAEDYQRGTMIFSSHMPDLVILDLDVSFDDALTLILKIRENSTVPIIAVSQRTAEDDKVTALDTGANDYIEKPFGFGEFMARVRSALRSHRYADAPRAEFKSGGLAVNYDSRRLFIDGNEINLTQTEYNIVKLLSKHSGKVMTYNSIIKTIWGYSDYGSIKKLQVNMANIRKKIAVYTDISYIENNFGVGYRIKDEKE